MNDQRHTFLSMPELCAEPELRPLLDVDLSRSPYDIRPAVHAIMTLQNWIMDRIPRGQKVVILIGETHYFQTNMLLQEAVFGKLHEQRNTHQSRNFAVGYEFEHNFLEKEDCTEDADDNCLTAFIKSKRGFQSKTAKNALFKSCLDRDISVSFNDVAITKTWYGHALDLKDQRTHDLVATHRPDLLAEEIPRFSEDRSFSDTDGMGLSNRSMVEGALQHMASCNAGLYVQQCGADHMFGSHFLSYKTSLHNLFSAADCFVLPIIGSVNYMSIPQAATEPFRNAIKIRGMDEAREGDIDYRTVRSRVYHATEGLISLFP